MLARSYVWWLNLDDDIEKIVSVCTICQRTQNDNVPKVFLPLPKSLGPWQRIHVDLLDTFKSKVLILVDEYLKWVECFLLKSTNADCIVSRLSECFSRFGFPQCVVSDNGPPFNSFVYSNFLSKDNIKVIYSPPYNPSSNGEAERFVQTVKKALIKSVVSSSRNLDYAGLKLKLDACLAALRFSPSTVTKKSPAELLLSYPIRNHLSMLSPCDDAQPHSFHGNIRTFNINDKVLVKNPAKGIYKWSCARVMEKIGNVMYLVMLFNGVIRRVHINQMKASKLPDQEHPDTRDTSWLPPRVVEPSPTVSDLVPDQNPVPVSQQTPRKSERIRRPPQRFSP